MLSFDVLLTLGYINAENLMSIKIRRSAFSVITACDYCHHQGIGTIKKNEINVNWFILIRTKTLFAHFSFLWEATQIFFPRIFFFIKAVCSQDSVQLELLKFLLAQLSSAEQKIWMKILQLLKKSMQATEHGSAASTTSVETKVWTSRQILKQIWVWSSRGPGSNPWQ